MINWRGLSLKYTLYDNPCVLRRNRPIGAADFMCWIKDNVVG